MSTKANEFNRAEHISLYSESKPATPGMNSYTMNKINDLKLRFYKNVFQYKISKGYLGIKLKNTTVYNSGTKTEVVYTMIQMHELFAGVNV